MCRLPSLVSVVVSCDSSGGSMDQVSQPFFYPNTVNECKCQTLDVNFWQILHNYNTQKKQNKRRANNASSNFY